MIKLRERVLKNISIINILLLYYPTVLFTRVVIFKTNEFLPGFLVLLLSLYFGVFIKSSKLKKILNIEGLHKRILTNVFGSLLVFLFTYLFFKDLGRVRSVYEIIPALIFFQTGIKIQSKNYQDMFETKEAVIGILGIIFLNIALFLNGLKVPFLLYVDAFLSVFSLLMLFNQVNIDNEIMSKSNTKGISEYINKFNYNLMFKIFIYFIILFNLNFIVKYIIKLVIKLGILIVNLFIKFISLFSHDKIDNTSYMPPSNYNFAEGNSSSIFGKILNIIILVLIAVLVFKFLPKLLVFIKNSFNRFLEYIKFITKEKKKEPLKEKDYVDDVEIIKENLVFNDKNREKLKQLKKYRNFDKQELQNIKDLNKKIRIMYFILLYKVVSYCNIELKKSNTTNEIKNEILKKLKINEINGITNTYNKIRYGDKNVTEDEFIEFKREYDLITEKCRKNK